MGRWYLAERAGGASRWLVRAEQPVLRPLGGSDEACTRRHGRRHVGIRAGAGTAGRLGSQPANPGAAPPASSSPAPTATPKPTATPTPAPTATPKPTATPAPTTGPSTPAPAQVVSSHVAYPWHWPNDVNKPGRVAHSNAVPPVPALVGISVGNHPAAAGQRPFNRMSFTFTTAFPSYRFEFASQLVSDGSGTVIPLRGQGVLKIVFTQAQAHTSDGTGSTIVSQPARYIGFQRMTDFAQAGDFEGVLSYGIGITQPVLHSNPQFPVRAYELETVTATGQHRYTIAIDIDASA